MSCIWKPICDSLKGSNKDKFLGTPIPDIKDKKKVNNMLHSKNNARGKNLENLGKNPRLVTSLMLRFIKQKLLISFFHAYPFVFYPNIFASIFFVIIRKVNLLAESLRIKFSLFVLSFKILCFHYLRHYKIFFLSLFLQTIRP